ncbi:MAG: serine hydrolase, partial [Verrucomicrobia bacterium]|nr:serine hydrolase [Verrucomicrobiota bacterium]
MREAGIPGAAFAVISNTSIVHFQGIGFAGPDNRPIHAQTPFGIGSISKSFAALAAMQLVEAGKLDLNASVQHYLPAFRTADSNASARITVRHLIYHQSGLPTFVNHADSEGKHDPTEALNRAIRFMEKVNLKDPPGRMFRYSDPGYVVLAAVVQEICGRPFEQYLQEAIFSPLGMKHSFTSEIAGRKDGAATGYRYWFGKPVAHDGLSSCYFDPLAGGGIYCSAEDLAKYLIAHMKNGQNGSASV